MSLEEIPILQAKKRAEGKKMLNKTLFERSEFGFISIFLVFLRSKIVEFIHRT